MSTNGANVEDAEMAECEGEKVVTMMDVLKEQQEFEDDANAVLGASDDKNCTYSKGYIKRQALYACLTCCNEAKLDPEKRAGVCLACSLTCHENHDLIELYTKRNFRCDCGNPKFNQPCQYTEKKSTLNEENIYNQNFSGLYCTCHRPYPDPDGVEEEMIQCIVCEDWLHVSHLEATVPSAELYAEMICKACMDKNEFLHDYSKFAVNNEVDTVDPNETVESSVHCNGDANKMNGVGAITDLDKTECEEINVTDKDGVDESEKVDIPTEAMNTSHENIEETKPEEQIESNVSSENTVEENQVEQVSDKTGAENLAEDNSTKDVVADTTDNANLSEENQVNDIIDKETPSSNEISDNTLGDNLDSAVLPGDQENLDATNNKDTVNATDVNVSEQNQQVNPEEIQQESSENDASADQQNADKPEEDLKIDGGEKPDPADSIAMSDANENLTTLQVAETNSENEMKENKRKLSTEESTLDISAKKPRLSESDCLRTRGENKMFKGATFWPSHFRQKLCTCNECITMYKDLSILFLIDPEDTVTAYEVLGKEKTDAASTQYEKGLEALSSLGRIQQINALTEYNKMRDKLLDYLKSFKDRKEVVKEEDIKAFFAGMKPKREPDGVYFCR